MRLVSHGGSDAAKLAIEGGPIVSPSVAFLRALPLPLALPSVCCGFAFLDLRLCAGRRLGEAVHCSPLVCSCGQAVSSHAGSFQLVAYDHWTCLALEEAGTKVGSAQRCHDFPHTPQNWWLLPQIFMQVTHLQACADGSVILALMAAICCLSSEWWALNLLIHLRMCWCVEGANPTLYRYSC